MEYTPEEQKENRRKWITALRSGDYKQGKHLLKNTKNEFCCLGVACDLYVKDNPKNSKWKYGQFFSEFMLIEDNGNIKSNPSNMPDKVRNYYGILYTETLFFVLLNDNKNLSFKEIADYIENRYQ